MPSTSPAWLSRVAMTLVGCTYGLVVLGSAVRANGAGLACPDWPLCFGQVVPAIDFGVAFEFGHRVIAGLVSLGFTALAIGVLRDPVARRRVGPLVGGAAAVLVVQIVLGGLTVLELLAEWTVTSHLLAGNTFCLLLFTIALALREIRAPVTRPAVSGWARVGGGVLAVALAAQLALGGFVASSHAGLACGTWPSCNGAGWFPTFSGLVGLQVTHRVLAYTLLAIAVVVAGAARGRGRFGRVSLGILSLVLLQALLGILNVMLRLPPEVTVLHSAGAAALVLSVTFLNVEAWRAPSLAAISRAHTATFAAQEVR